MSRCPGSAGVSRSVDVAGTSRCFRLVTPSSSGGGASPVLLMMHGRTGDASQFCTQDFASTATSYGLALVCLQAIAGNWQFGQLPWDDVHDDFGLAVDSTGNACDDDDSDDLAYVRTVLSYLEDESDASGSSAYDASRFFVAGFSQGALMAALTAFCVVPIAGLGQAGSSFGRAKFRVAPTSPPLRVCVWCNRDDSACKPMDGYLEEAGHDVMMRWSRSGGHSVPNNWARKLAGCLRVDELRGDSPPDPPPQLPPPASPSPATPAGDECVVLEAEEEDMDDAWCTRCDQCSSFCPGCNPVLSDSHHES